MLVELGYHDNAEDAAWLTGSLDTVAAALSEGVTEYFGLPFLPPVPVREGIVSLASGSLYLRALPTTEAQALAQIPNGAPVRILGTFDAWYSAEYDGLYGFVASRYITLSSE